MNFQDREVQYPNRIKLTKISEEHNGNVTYDVERVEGAISNPGTPLNAATLNSLATKADLAEIVYPIGSIYINATYSSNPKILLGCGEWKPIGQGRVLIGVGNNGETNHVLGETGGSESAVVDHTHPIAHTHSYAHTHEHPEHYHGLPSTAANNSQDDYQWVSPYGNTKNGGAIATGTIAELSVAGANATRYVRTSTNSRYPTEPVIIGSTNSQSTTTTGAASNANSGINNATSKLKTLPPYFTCYIWVRIA